MTTEARSLAPAAAGARAPAAPAYVEATLPRAPGVAQRRRLSIALHRPPQGAGVVDLFLDLEAGRLRVGFDPAVLSHEAAQRLAHTMAARLLDVDTIARSELPVERLLPCSTCPLTVECALRRLGIRRLIVLTGDHAAVGAAVGAQLQADDVRGEAGPEEKAEVVQDLRRAHGDVAMVGDGINDAPALAAATVGIAMGAAGTDVALETADVVLMSSDLRQVAYAVALGRRARRVIRQNVTFALAVIATLVSATLLGHLRLPLAVVGHEGSTVLVVLNGLRLLGALTPGPRQAQENQAPNRPLVRD